MDFAKNYKYFLSAFFGVDPSVSAIIYTLTLDALFKWIEDRASEKFLVQLIKENQRDITPQQYLGITWALIEYQYTENIGDELINRLRILVENNLYDCDEEDECWIINILKILKEYPSRYNLHWLTSLLLRQSNQISLRLKIYILEVIRCYLFNLNLNSYQILELSKELRNHNFFQIEAELPDKLIKERFQKLLQSYIFSKATRTRKPYDIAISLSGGGFRASLFHAGLLLRLNEFLKTSSDKFILRRIVSVSGGSITAAYFCNGYDLNDFVSLFKKTIRKSKALKLLVSNIPNPFFLFKRINIFSKVIDNVFFKGNKLTFDSYINVPSLCILTYNLERGRPLILSKSSLRDHPNFLISDAVAASCAFPFVFNSLKLKKKYVYNYLGELYTEKSNDRLVNGETIRLYDGGLVDNTGLYSIIRESEKFNIVICSDSGTPLYHDYSSHSFNPFKKYIRYLNSSLSEVIYNNKQICRLMYGDLFLEASPNIDIRNVPTFDIPNNEDIDQLVESGQNSANVLIADLSSL